MSQAISGEIIPRGAPAGRPAKAARVTVKKRGALASLFLPIGVGAAVLVVGVPTFMIWNIYSASEARRLEHEAPVDRGETAVTAKVTRQVADGETEFVLRLIDGKLVRVIAARDATDAFLNRTLIALDSARDQTHQRATAGINRVFAEAFASRNDDLADYADWFFEWGRSWRLLYEAVAGAVQEAVRLSFSQTQITDAARQAVEAYLLRHYQDFVLKPGVRDQAIVAGIRTVLETAHRDYLASVAKLDDDMQRFLAENTHYAEPIPGDAINVVIDWDAEKWKAPRHYADDSYLRPVASAAVIGGSAVLGGMLERIVLPFFARTTAQVIASTELTLGGAAAGSISPGIGTAVGALAGLALDWGFSLFTEYMQRDDFIADNAAALDATIAAWKAEVTPEIDKAIDVWFDDTRAVVAQQATAAR